MQNAYDNKAINNSSSKGIFAFIASVVCFILFIFSEISHWNFVVMPNSSLLQLSLLLWCASISKRFKYSMLPLFPPSLALLFTAILGVSSITATRDGSRGILMLGAVVFGIGFFVSMIYTFFLTIRVFKKSFSKEKFLSALPFTLSLCSILLLSYVDNSRGATIFYILMTIAVMLLFISLYFVVRNFKPPLVARLILIIGILTLFASMVLHALMPVPSIAFFDPQTIAGLWLALTLIYFQFVHYFPKAKIGKLSIS